MHTTVFPRINISFSNTDVDRWSDTKSPYTFRSYGGFNLFHKGDNELATLKQELGTGLYQYDNTVYFTAGYDSPFSFTNRHNEVWLMAVDTSPEKAVVG